MQQRRLRRLLQTLESRLSRQGVEIGRDDARPVVLRLFSDVAIQMAEIKAWRSPDNGERG